MQTQQHLFHKQLLHTQILHIQRPQSPTSSRVQAPHTFQQATSTTKNSKYQTSPLSSTSQLHLTLNSLSPDHLHFE